MNSSPTSPVSPVSGDHSSIPLTTSISNNSTTSDSSLESQSSNYGTKTPSGNARIYNCKLCQRAFTREEHLTRHTLSTHNKLKPFRCGICSRPFSRRDLLLRHAKNLHQGSEVAVSRIRKVINIQRKNHHLLLKFLCKKTRKVKVMKVTMVIMTPKIIIMLVQYFQSQ